MALVDCVVNCSKLKIARVNIRSIMSKLGALSEIKKYNYDVVAVSETWLNPGWLMSELILTITGCDSLGGGVCLYN